MNPKPNLFDYIKQKALNAFNAASNFVTQNPTPAGFIGNQVQQRVIQPAQQAVQQNVVQPFQRMTQPQTQVQQPNIQNVLSSILERAKNTPISPMGITYNNAPTYKAPLEEILSKVPEQIKIGMPALKVPEMIGSTIRDYGQLAHGQVTPQNVTTAALDFIPLAGAGIKAIKPEARAAINSIDNILSTAKKDKLGNIIDKTAIKLLDKIPKNKFVTEVLQGNKVVRTEKIAPSTGGEIGKPFYHVTSTENANLIRQQGFKAQVGERSMGATKGKGVFLYESPEPTAEFGKNFTRVGKTPEVLQTNVNGKIFDAMNDENSIRSLAENTKLINKLKSEGYVGIRGDELGTPVTFVFEPKALKVSGGEIGGIPKSKSINEILTGTNKPLETTNNYLRPQGASPLNFIADESGGISPVRPMSKKATEQIPTTVLPSEGGVRGLLPSGEKPIAGLLEAPKPPVENPLLKNPESFVSGTPKGFLRKTWDMLVPSSKKVIEGSGPSGKQVSSLLTKADEEGSILGGGQADQLFEAFKSLTKQEKISFADVVEGRMRPSTQNQLNAVKIWNNISGDIYTRARAAGLDIGQIDKYFPHNVLIDTKSPNAKMMLSRSGQRRYGNLEMSRQTDVPYDKDPSVLFDYIYSANNRIADAKYFGQDDRILYNLANQTAKEGGDTSQVVKYLDQILGKNQGGEFDQASRSIRGVQTVLKLNPLTSLTNLTQNISTMMRTDVPTVLNTIRKTIADPSTAVSNARKAGEIDAEMSRALESFAGQGQGVTKWLRTIGMLGTEKVNRIIAVNAGMDYVAKLNKQALAGSKSAIRELDRLGLKPGKNIDTILGGKRVSRATQFSTREGELPHGWQTAIGKVLTQFKSFSYKQTGLLASEGKRIFVEAKNGNLKPLANALVTYGVAAPIVGEVVNDIRSVLTNKKREENSMGERYVSNILAATSFGLLDSTGGLFGKYGEKGVVSAALGPTAGDIAKTAETVTKIGSDQSYERNAALRNIVKTIPAGVGTAISNTVIPNSYVDNYIGVNTGLGEKDKATYNIMKQTNPTQAEAFKESRQKEREKTTPTGQPKQSFWQKVTGQQPTLTIPDKSATVTQKSEFNAQVKNVLDNGGIPQKDVLKEGIFSGKTAKSPLVEERMDVYKKIRSAMDNETYTPEQKSAIVEASGAPTKDVEYYMQASKDKDVKLQELMPQLENMGEEELMTFLGKGRRTVAGQQLVTPEMITYLYDQELISDDQKKALSALKFDEGTGKFYYSRSYSGGSDGSGTKKLTYAQAKAIFNVKLPSFSSLQKGTSTQSNASGATLISSILSKKPTKIKLK